MKATGIRCAVFNRTNPLVIILGIPIVLAFFSASYASEAQRGHIPVEPIPRIDGSSAQSPLTPGGCTDDVLEFAGSGGTDDTCWGALIDLSSPQSHLHCDEDWVYFNPIPGATYEIETSNLIGGSDTTLAVHENCGPELAFDDDGGVGLASRIEWTATSTNPIDMRVRQYADAYADGEGYDITVNCIADCAGTQPEIAISPLTLTFTDPSFQGAPIPDHERPSNPAERAHSRATLQPYHYLVVEFDERGTITPLFHRLVEIHHPADPTGAAEAGGDQSSVARGDAVASTVFGPGGEVVWSKVSPIERTVRGEFRDSPVAGGGWVIDAHHLVRESGAFVVRAPHVPGASLKIEHGPGTLTVDLDQIASEADRLPLAAIRQQAARLATLGAAGNPANRVDVLVMGDGFTSAPEFEADAGTLVDSFFDLTPYSDYRSHVNVYTLYSPSNEAGADHPPYDPDCPIGDRSCCADPEAMNDPLSGTYVDTAFDGRFCESNIHRLTVVDTALVLAAASAVPDWDRILVLLNDPTYGGSGGFIGVATTHALSVDVMQHEFGHTFTGLADEYETPYPGYPPCSDVTGPPCEPNVTDQTIRALIKWEPWIDPATPVPTPAGDPLFTNDVGLFEGARYLASGMFRPRDAQCLMRFVGQPFGEVCAQTYVLRLYDGGWGVPALGIDPIEPGSETPPPGLVAIAPSDTLTLSVSLLSPAGGPPLEVGWWVNGVLQPGIEGDSYEFDPPDEGNYDIEVRVSDATTLVHPEMAGDSLESQRSWTVNVSSGEQPFTIFNTGTDDLDVDLLALETPAPWITWLPQGPFVVPPGGSQLVTVAVDFSLAPEGQTTRRILVESNDADESPYPGGVFIEVNKAACYTLTLGHTGQGADPVATPAASEYCPEGEYVAGEFISLTAQPDPGWMTGGWSGTNNNPSTSNSNSVTMPASDHLASVNYIQVAPCTDDALESAGFGGTDDTCWGSPIGLSSPQTHLHCDGDWVYFNPIPGATYEIVTSNLIGGSDTTLVVHENCGPEVAFDDDGGVGLASRIEWTATSTKFIDVRIRQYADAYADGKGYAITVNCIANCGPSDEIISDGFERDQDALP